MNKLALHWQILIGMVIGTVVGIGLNLTASERETEIPALDPRLPETIQSAFISDTTARTTIEYTKKGEEETPVKWTIHPLGGEGNNVTSVKELKKVDAFAADIYLAHGQSTAKRFGGMMKSIGGLFLRMLQMVAVPLIVVSLLSGVLGLGLATEPKDGSTSDSDRPAGIGKMFTRTLLYYVCTSGLAIITGLLVVNIIRPGLGGNAAGAMAKDADAHAKPLSEVLFNQVEALIPANPLGAFTEPNFLSIIAFTLAFAVFALRCSRETQDRIRSLAEAGLDVMMSMTMAIISLAPLGVLFLMGYVSATQGTEVFSSLGKYVIAVAAALALHACVTLPLILYFIADRSPLDYVKAMSPALLTAFSSASSNGTLPLTMTSVRNRAGVSNRTSSFVLPLGATINMDGTALYEVVAVLFIAQLHGGQNLPLSQQIIVALTALLASVGAAGIPHAGLVMMVIILQAVGLPIEMQGIILAVDRVLDMARTAVNVWSDSCGCAVIDKVTQEAETLEENLTLPLGG